MPSAVIFQDTEPYLIGVLDNRPNSGESACVSLFVRQSLHRGVRFGKDVERSMGLLLFFLRQHSSDETHAHDGELTNNNIAHP
jgi:hypothetical protein